MDQPVEPRKTFNEILMECIEEILTAIGGSAKHMIYFFLNQDLGITKDQIPNRIDDFAETIESIFGAGAKPIERHLIKQIEAKTKITYPFPVQASSLQDCTIFIRQEYERGNNR